MYVGITVSKGCLFQSLQGMRVQVAMPAVHGQSELRASCQHCLASSQGFGFCSLGSPCSQLPHTPPLLCRGADPRVLAIPHLGLAVMPPPPAGLREQESSFTECPCDTCCMKAGGRGSVVGLFWQDRLSLQHSMCSQTPRVLALSILSLP